MKGQLLHKIILVLLLSPVHLFAQPVSLADRDITGLWKGSLYNDTTRQHLPYEIAISEEAGKLSGYSYTLFDIDGKKELGVKKVRIKIKDDQLTIEDIELISNTYSAPAPRGIRQQSVAYLSVNDTAMQLTGKWSTNRTRQYLPLTGSLQLERALDFRPLALFKILESLKLANELSFVKLQTPEAPVMAMVERPVTELRSPVAGTPKSLDIDRPAKLIDLVAEKKAAMVIEDKPVNNEITPIEKPVMNPPVVKQEVTAIAIPGKILSKFILKDLAVIKTKSSKELVKTFGNKPKVNIIPFTIKKKEIFVAVNNIQKENKQPDTDKAKIFTPPPIAKKTEPVAIVVPPVKKENKPANEIVKKPIANEKPVIITAPVINKTASVITIKDPVTTEIKTISVAVIPPEQKKEVQVVAAMPMASNAAVNVLERKMKNEQSVIFESDSLVLTLYDNGEVDGDTVSVLMNGQIIFARQGLSTKANSKTIYIDKGMPDSLSMVMYAENLGSIPPNTGLLIIMDGDKRYEVRFSADLKTNAAILLRRKPKVK